MIATPSKYLPWKVLSFLQQHCHYSNYLLNSCSEIAITLKAQYLNILIRAMGEHPQYLISKQPPKVAGMMNGGLSIWEAPWWKTKHE